MVFSKLGGRAAVFGWVQKKKHCRELWAPCGRAWQPRYWNLFPRAVEEVLWATNETCPGRLGPMGRCHLAHGINLSFFLDWQRPLQMVSHKNDNLNANKDFVMLLTSKFSTCFTDGFTSGMQSQSNCLFTKWKYTYKSDSKPWRWSALNMGSMDKWPSRMQVQCFLRGTCDNFWSGSKNLKFFQRTTAPTLTPTHIPLKIHRRRFNIFHILSHMGYGRKKLGDQVTLKARSRYWDRI